MVCHDRRRRRGQATVQRHRFIVGITVSAVIVGATAVGAIAAAIAIRAIIAATVSRGRGEDGSKGDGGGYRGGNDVSVRGSLVSNAVTHPMAVLATGVQIPSKRDGPFRSWPRGPFARTVPSGAPSRRARAAIPLEATLRRWYRRRMAPRIQSSPSAVLAVSGDAAVAAGG